MDAGEVLKTYFGYDSFRPRQAEIVAAIEGGRDVLAVMPTGAGKSLCYQVPALMSDGITLVVSPLISLMKDQVNALATAGVSAAYLNSSLTGAQQTKVLQQAATGAYKLLYVAPERLLVPGFLEFCNAHPPVLVAIDEAHCISQWGQDFRPSYTRIDEFIDALPQRPTVAAFTATATRAVRDDILQQLHLANPLLVVSSFDRPNLHFKVERSKDKNSALKAICKEHPQEVGVVYCTARKTVEEVCSYLQEQGISATRYHAGLSAAERHTNQEDWLFDRAAVMVATNAFGMGIDKSNVSFVVHYNMPLDLESYYQEAGRAGRDGESADCVLLYAPKDVRTCEFLLNAGYSENADIDAPTRALLLARAKDRLRQMTFYSTTTDCLRSFILKYFDESAPVYCGNCGNCETTFEEVDATVEAQKIISCVYRLAQRGRSMGKVAIVDILRGSKSAKILDAGFDSLSTYGIMADVSAHRARFLLDCLIDRGFLRFTAGTYPVVEMDNRGLEFLRHKESFVVKVPKDKQPEAQSSGKKRRSTDIDQHNQGLYDHLRGVRHTLSTEEEVPAYVVFSNRTLHDMCRVVPRTLEEFLSVDGVGQVKAQRYAKPFLAAIEDYLNSSAREETSS